MRSGKFFYLPLALPFFLLILIIGVLFLLVTLFVGAITSGFQRIGFSAIQAVFLFLVSILGSTINIPLYEKENKVSRDRQRDFKFMGFRFPKSRLSKRVEKTTISMNLGGAVIPIIASIYIIVKFPELLPSIILATIIMSILSYKIARPVKGVGITLPTLIPPILAALMALILSPENGPQLAYSSGVMGVLIGADILNLSKINNFETPVISIGGAGTFDGIFLTGIVAALIAPVGI
ncbi:MAG: DUF1614 domain-containing protein [archaeon]